MRFQFKTIELEKLYLTVENAYKYPPEVVTAFLRVMAKIMTATDTRDLHAFKSLRYEKLKGNRQSQYSLRLNKQWRLIFEMHRDEHGTCLLIIQIEDYH